MQVEKAFREGTARQNAHSVFVSLALKLLEERVHVACKEIITLEKQVSFICDSRCKEIFFCLFATGSFLFSSCTGRPKLLFVYMQFEFVCMPFKFVCITLASGAHTNSSVVHTNRKYNDK